MRGQTAPARHPGGTASLACPPSPAAGRQSRRASSSHLDPSRGPFCLAVVILSKQIDHVRHLRRRPHRNRHPSRRWKNVMRLRSSLRDKIVTDAPREGQIGDRSVQMAQFSPAVPEFNPAETVAVRRHAVPAGHGAPNRFDRIARRQDLVLDLGTIDCMGVLVGLHDWFLCFSNRVPSIELQVHLKSRRKIGQTRSMKDTMTIAEVARRSGVAPSALRFYEQEGLLQSERTGAGHRRYSRAVIRRVAFIVFAQKVGLTLDEIGTELAKLPSNQTPDRGDWAQLSGGWRKRIDERIGELERLRDGLTECIGCGCLSLDRCRLANPGDRAARRGAGPRYWIEGRRTRA